MAINAVIHITILTVSAWIQAGKKGNSVDLVSCGVIVMLKTTLIPFGAGPAEEVVIAELAIILSFLDIL